MCVGMLVGWMQIDADLIPERMLRSLRRSRGGFVCVGVCTVVCSSMCVSVVRR